MSHSPIIILGIIDCRLDPENPECADHGEQRTAWNDEDLAPEIRNAMERLKETLHDIPEEDFDNYHEPFEELQGYLEGTPNSGLTPEELNRFIHAFD